MPEFTVKSPDLVWPLILRTQHSKTDLQYLSQLMRFWYLSHRRLTKAQASMHIHAVSPEPSLFAHMEVDEGSDKKSDI